MHRTLRLDLRPRVTRILTIVTVVAASVASAADRVVPLTLDANVNFPRVQIVNPTDRTITFTLGFNDQLFANKEDLVRQIRDAENNACRGVPLREDANLPCAAYKKVASSMLHWPEISDQLDDMGTAKTPRLWLESPMLAMNSFGFGTCGTFANVLAKVWQELGYEIRRRALNGHTVTEVQVGGRWILFDANMQVFFTDRRRVLGVDDLIQRLAINRKQKVIWTRPPRVRALPYRKQDYPHAGPSFYSKMLVASKGPWLEPTGVPASRDDWRDLTFTLPPRARLVFPEESENECFSPLLYDTSHDTNRTNAPHQYAIVEIPAGTTTEVENGLYPARITGDYCVNSRYIESSSITNDFDQIHQFRQLRRFARAFSPLEAYSDVLIYYMVNSKVRVGKQNQVRLRGDHVELLEVGLTSAAAANLPAGVDPPCIAPDRTRQRLPIKTVWATSYSYGNPALGKLLVDGKMTTAWISEYLSSQTPQEIVLDLGTLQNVEAIRLAPFDTYALLAPVTMQVKTSLDGTTYDDASSISDYRPSHVQWFTSRFEPRVARYIRLTVTPPPHFDASQNFQAALAEVEVLASSAEAPAVSP